MSDMIDVVKLIEENKRQAVKSVLNLLFNEKSRVRKIEALGETCRYGITKWAEIAPTYCLFEEEIDDIAKKYSVRFVNGKAVEEDANEKY